MRGLDVGWLVVTFVRTGLDQENCSSVEARPSDIRRFHKQTIDDLQVTVPTPLAVEILLRNVPLDVAYASQLCNLNVVHVSPAVKLPREIAHQLSVGLKYTPYQPMNTRLFTVAWQDVQNRLRWRLKFLVEKKTNDIYDPGYDPRSQSAKHGPLLLQHLELGLIEGRRFVYSTIAKTPDQEAVADPTRRSTVGQSMVEGRTAGQLRVGSRAAEW